MKIFRNRFGAALALLAAALMPASAMATTVITGQQSQTNTVFYDVEALTSAYSNSTTTASDVTGMTTTVPATIGTSAYQYVEVCWNAQVAKATATTGSISVVVNGVSQSTSTRTVQVTAGQPIAACYYMQRPTDAAFVVKLQGVSGDTNAFSVSQAQMSVRVIFTLV